MNLPEDTHLAYVVWHEAWYAKASRAADPREHPHLMVMAAAEGGGVAWEFQIDGYDLGRDPVTRVKMFEDSYAAFADMPEFFRMLAEQRPTTLDTVRSILHALGAVDQTERVSPYPDRPAQPAEIAVPVDLLNEILGAPGTENAQRLAMDKVQELINDSRKA